MRAPGGTGPRIGTTPVAAPPSAVPAQRSAGPGEPGAPGDLRLPGLRPLYAAILESCVELAGCGDAWEAELWTTGMWRSLRERAPEGADVDAALLDLVDEAERAGSNRGYLFLRTLAVAAPATGSAAAGAAADRLAGAEPALDTKAPGWVSRLGAASAGEAHVFTDVFAEQDQVIVEFTHDDGGQRHAFVLTVERTYRGLPGRVDLYVGARAVEDLLAGARSAAEKTGGTIRSVPVAEAASAVRAALAAGRDPASPRTRTRPVLSAASEGVLPLLEHRLLVTAPPPHGHAGGDRPAELPAVLEEWSEEARAQLVDEFLDACDAVLGDVERADAVADRLVDVSVEVLLWPPDRLGPHSVERLVLDLAAATLIAPDPVLDDVALVLREWMIWRTQALRLPPAATDRLRAAVGQAIELLPRALRDRSVNELYPYVADLGRDQAEGGELNRVLERRCFAVPLPRTRSAASRRLDAARVADRRAIVADWLGPAADDRLVAARAGVVEQLWTGTPAEVWTAARAWAEGGRAPREVIEALAIEWEKHGPTDVEALRTGREVTDFYLTSLRG